MIIPSTLFSVLLLFIFSEDYSRCFILCEKGQVALSIAIRQNINETSLLYSNSHLSTGDKFQEPLWVHETTDTCIPVIKFNVQIRYSKSSQQ